MRTLIAATLALVSTAALAQQASPERVTAAQLGQQLGLLMQENNELRAQLASAQAKVKELSNRAEGSGSADQKPQPAAPK